MENTEKVEECVVKEAVEAVQVGDNKPKEEESIREEVIATTEITEKAVESQENLEITPIAEQNKDDADGACEAGQLIKDGDIELKTYEKAVELVKHEVEDEPPRTIEECDTGGDEIAAVSIECEPTSTNAVLEYVEKDKILPACEGDVSEEKPILLTELKSVPQEAQSIIEIKADEDRSEVVAIDDDDDDDVDDDGGDEEDDDDDGDDEDEDEDEEDDDAGLYLDEDMEKIEKRSSSSRDLRELPHALIDFDEDEYDDEDDDEEDDTGMVELKDESNVAFVIGSSDEEEVVQRAPIPLKKQEARKYEAMQDDLDYEDDDDEDEYDDDDLMNAAVTSVTKALSSTASTSSSPIKKQLHARKENLQRVREAEQISVLTRRINYGRIVKKKSLNWLYNKKKREAYKLILPKFRSTKAAMRSDQSGGLLHLKISQSPVTSIDSKALTKASATGPIVARVESHAPIASSIPQNQSKEEYVIDLDSSPEKPREKSISARQQSDDQRDPEISVKKPPDFRHHEENATMQQTDKVRDSIQKSAEQVEEVKSVARLTCEQNKENLQSNKSVKNEKDEETPKNETESKDTSAPTEDSAMDIVEDASESTIKAKNFIASTVSSFNVDIKEEKIDKTVTTPPTTEETTASKVTVEDVDETEAPRTTISPQPASVGATKRRRSSSFTVQDRNKVSKPTSGTATDEGDDEDYVHPTKKLREELQSSYPAHDRILNEYIEKTNNDSIDTIQRHIEQMLSEIQTLNDMIKAKEVEWNSMLHLKKVKEEICFRLTRRKQCMEIMATKVGEAGHSAGLDEDYQGNESILGFGKTTPPQQNPHLSSTPIAATINSIASNICNFTAVSSSSSAAPTTAQLIVQNRANMKSSDLVKEKANTQRLQRLLVSSNILPKPAASPTSVAGGSSQQGPSTNGGVAPSSSNQPILNSYLTSSDSVQQLVDMMNGHHNNHSGLLNGGVTGSNNNNNSNSQAAMVGRQGPFKDVRSIIADFRQQHPEVVPRRGRRVKNSNNSNLSDSNTILGNALKSDTNSRPSSNDSSSHSMSNTNQSTTTHNNVNTFKDVLAPFAKSQGAASLRSTSGHQQNPPYPEVTLHPVSTPLNASGGQDQPTGSLLHGILTKFSRPTESVNTKSVANQTSASYISNFSPTLARLLTAPERISASGSVGSSGNQGHHSSAANVDQKIPNFGVNLSKVVGHNSEITITPVMNSMHQQSMLQHQLQQQQQLKEVLSRVAAVSGGSSGTGVKEEHFLKLSSLAAASAANDDDAEDSVDRLVIDEGVDSMAGGEEHQRIAPHAIGQEFNENEVPVCQGCKKHEAQFVCAGCGNQWYCSRECQVTAWDDHSEVCTG